MKNSGRTTQLGFSSSFLATSHGNGEPRVTARKLPSCHNELREEETVDRQSRGRGEDANRWTPAQDRDREGKGGRGGLVGATQGTSKLAAAKEELRRPAALGQTGAREPPVTLADWPCGDDYHAPRGTLGAVASREPGGRATDAEGGGAGDADGL